MIKFEKRDYISESINGFRFEMTTCYYCGCQSYSDLCHHCLDEIENEMD